MKSRKEGGDSYEQIASYPICHPIQPKKEMRCYLVATTESVTPTISLKLLDETARLFGFRSFEEFTHYMWPFDASIRVRTVYSTNAFRIDRNGELIAMMSYSGVIAEIPNKKCYIEPPILIPITDPTLIPDIVKYITIGGHKHD